MKNEKEEIKNEILSILINQAPNKLYVDMLCLKLDKFSEPLIDDAIQELKLQQRITEELIVNKQYPDRKRTSIGLKNYENIPVKTSINIGDVKFPRFVQGDLVGAEEFNFAFEALSEYNSQLEERFKEISEDLTQSYWKNLISIFGIMLSTFAIIIKAISTTTPFDYQTVTLIDIFLIRSAEFLPLGILLLLGIWLSRKLVI